MSHNAVTGDNKVTDIPKIRFYKEILNISVQKMDLLFHQMLSPDVISILFLKAILFKANLQISEIPTGRFCLKSDVAADSML